MSGQLRKPKPAPTAGQGPVRRKGDLDPTAQLVLDFARQLGLDLSRVSIETDTAAGRVARAHGAHGLVCNGTAHIDPLVFEPTSGQGRALLAHEMTHLAQMQQQARTEEAPDAEAEARAMGARAAALMPLRAPAARLAPGGIAGDTGVGVNTAKAKPAAQRNDPEPASAAKMRRDIRTRTPEIARAAADARGELNRLMRGIVDDDHVSSALRILEDFSFVDAAALVRSMEIPSQRRIPDELKKAHYRSYPRAILAAYAGLVPKQIDLFDVDHFRELQLAQVNGEALIGFDLVFDAIANRRSDLAAEILESPAGDQYAKRLVDPFGSPQPDRRDRDRGAQDGKDAPELPKGLIARAASIADRAKLDLSEKANADTAREVLNKVRALSAQKLDVAEEQSGGEKDDPLAMFGGALRSPPPVLRFIGERMAKNGALQLLWELTDTDDARAARYAGVFFGLMASRPVWRNLEDIVTMLSRSFTDWAVRDWEAEYAYRLLRVMPLEAQYRFRQIEGGKFHRRLEEEIPKALKQSGVYIGVEVRKDKDGGYTTTAKDYAALFAAKDKQTVARRKQVSELLAWAEENSGKGRFAEEMFAKLWAFAGRDRLNPQPSTELTFLVRSLDRMGAITEMIDDLSDAFLFDVDRRPITNLILMSRDARYLMDHAIDLMSTTFLLDTAVTDRDAYVAFLLIRALPPVERDRFLAMNGGEAMGKIWSELHERMRKSRDMHLFVEREGGLNRADVLARLQNEKEGESLWVAARVHELDAQIRIAIAYGDYRTVFEISKRRKAFEIEALDPVVQRHKLYDERPGSARTEPDADALPTSILSSVPALQFLQPLGRALIGALPTLTSALDLFIFGSDLLVGPRGSGFRFDIEKGLNLAKIAADYTALETPEGGSEREGRGKDENLAAVSFDLPARQMILQLPNLQLQGFNDLMGGWRVNMGPISLQDLKVTATYGDRAFSEAKRIDAEAASLGITSAGFTGPETVVAFGALILSTLDLGAEMHGAPDEKMPEKTRGIWLPLPLLLPAVLGLIEVATHLGDAFSTETRDRLTGRRFSFKQLEIKGFSTNKGLGLQALTISDFSLGVATTPVQHLENRKAQIGRQLKALSPADRDGDPGKALREELGKINDGLGKARANEEERQRLKRQHKDDPKSLTPQQLKRLIDLERSRVLGVTLDVGKIELSKLDSAVKLDSLTLGGISAHGAGKTAFQILASKGIDRLADPATLDLFGRRIAAESSAEGGGLPSQFDGEYALKIADVTAKGLGFAYVPDESMVKNMRKLASDLATAHPGEARYSQMQTRLDALMPDIRDYHALVEQDETGRLSTPDRERLAKLRRKLRDAFFIRVGEITASGVGLAASLGKSAELTVQFGQIALRDIRGLGIEIEAIEGTEVHLTIGLFVNMLQKVFHGRTSPGADMIASGAIKAKKLSVKGAFAEAFGLRVKNLDISNLNARADRDGEHAFLITVSELGSLGVTGLALLSGDSTLLAPGTAKVENAQLSLHVRTRTEEKDGETKRSLEAIRVDGKIGRIAYEGAGEPMSYEGPAPSKFQPKAKPGEPEPAPRRMKVAVHGGALGGIKISNFTRTFAKGETEGKTGDSEGMSDQSQAAKGGDREQEKGSIAITTIDALSVAGMIHESLSDPDANRQVTHEIEGKLSGNYDEKKPGGVAKAGAAALKVEFVEEAMSRILLDGVDLSDGLIVLGNNRVTIRALQNLAGDIGFEGNDIVVHGLSFDRLVLGNFRWRTATGSVLETRKDATLKVFSLSGRLVRDENAKFKSLKITSMVIKQLDAGYVRYHDPKKKITAVFGETSGSSKGISVRNLVVTDLDWTGGIPDAGSVKMDKLDVLFDLAFAKKLSAKGELGAKAIALDFFEDDRIVARFEDGSLDAQVKAGGKEAHVDIDDVSTGDTGKDGYIEYRHGKGMTISKLRVDRIGLDRLNVDGPSMKLAIPIPSSGAGATGEIALEDIKFSAEVDFQPSKHEDAPPVQEIRVTELEIPKITAKGMEVTLKSLGAVLTVPQSHEASILDVKLGKTDGKALFTVTAAFDEATGDTEWGLKGFLKTGAIDVPKFKAAMAGTLDAEGGLKIPSVEARFLGGADYKIDLMNPSLNALQVDLAKSGVPLIFKLLANPGGKDPYLGAEKISLTPEGLKILKGKSGKFELKLKSPDLTLEADGFDGSPEIGVTYAKPSASGTAGATDMEIDIRQASLLRATVDTPDLSAFMDKSGAGGASKDPLKVLEQTGSTYEPLLNSATGHINFNLFITRTEQVTFAPKEPINLPITLPIASGRADLSNVVVALGQQVERLVKEAKGSIAAAYVDTVRTDVDADSIDLQLGSDVYNALFTPEVAGDWATLVEFDLRDPPGMTVPTGVTEGSVPLRALFRINPTVGTARPPEGHPVDNGPVNIRNINVNLTLRNAKAFPFKFGKPAETHGVLELAPDAFKALQIMGNVVITDKGGKSQVDGRIQFGTERARLQNIDVTTKGGSQIKAGSITILSPKTGPAVSGAVEIRGSEPKALSAGIVQVDIRDLILRKPNPKASP